MKFFDLLCCFVFCIICSTLSVQADVIMNPFMVVLFDPLLALILVAGVILLTIHFAKHSSKKEDKK